MSILRHFIGGQYVHALMLKGDGQKKAQRSATEAENALDLLVAHIKDAKAGHETA